MLLKTSKGKKVTYSLICVLCFRAFSWLRLSSFGAFCAKSFRKKEFKTALITSFILLLNLSYYKHEFFLIAIFFNYHNLFQLPESFSIITIFFNLLWQLVTLSLWKQVNVQIHHVTCIFYRQSMTKVFCQFHQFLIYAFYFEFFSFCV